MKPYYYTYSSSMKAIFIVLILIALPWEGKSQPSYTGSLPKVSPVSPNAAALFKAVERPIGSYTGTTPISVPLYTITVGGLSVPISINYHNGGIRVEEVAGSVGLGWSLAAGGAVTRVLNGIPDETVNYGYLNASLKPSGFPGTDPVQNTVNQVLRGYLDIEPDIFFFNCNGISGKFYFDESGNIQLVDRAPLKVVPLMGNTSFGTAITGWDIIDDKGTKYEFRKYETSETTSSQYNHSWVSSWHLTRMVDMGSSNKVDFSYVASGSVSRTIAGGSVVAGAIIGTGCEDNDYQSTSILSQTICNGWLVSGISTNLDSVAFFSSASRLDTEGGRRIDSVHLRSKIGDGMRKRFHFNYGYFSAPHHPRLKLASLAELAATGSDSIAHTFDYIEDVNLPPWNSPAQDYWGFYNGKSSNNSLIPNGSYFDFNSNFYVVVSQFADRRADPAFAKANTLQKITFPTGGHREFIYEGNTYLMEYGSHITPDAVYDTVQNFSTNAFDTDPYAVFAYENYFTVNDNTGGVTLNFSLSATYALGNFRIQIGNTTFNNEFFGSVHLGNGTHRIVVYLDYAFDAGNNPISYYQFDHLECWWAEKRLPIRMIGRVNGAGDFYAGNMNGGGLRVREVKDYDPVAAKTYSTKYNYDIFTESGLTSGLLVSPVIAYNKGGCDTRDCQYLKLSSNSAYPLVQEGGSYIVYPEVTTIEDGNGYTKRKYSFQPDATYQNLSLNEFPLVPRRNKSWTRNKLLYEKNYNESGVLLRENHSWNQGAEGSEIATSAVSSTQLMLHAQLGYKSVGYWKMGDMDCSQGNNEPAPCAACWKDYTLDSHFDALRSSSTRDHTNGGSSVEIKTDYDYYYDDPKYPVLRSEKHYLSNGDISVTYYLYAFNLTNDFNLGLNPSEILMKDSLLLLHYIQPIEIRSYLKRGGDSTFIGGRKFTFGTFYAGSAGTAIRPSAVSNFTALDNAQVIRFSGYDVNGNITEQYRENNVKEIYLWGYNGNYPVAKVIGSDYNTVAALVSNAILQNPSSEGALRTELNKIRTGLAGSSAQVFTYTYKPGIGVGSMADIAGRITYYEYDSFGRLKLIRDQNNAILKQFDYQYKAPVTQ